VRLTTSTTSCAERHGICDAKTPGTLWATPGLLWDPFSMYFWILLYIEHNCDVTPEQIVIIHKSFNYLNLQSDTLYWQTVGNGTKNKIYKQAAVFTADCYSKHVNTLIPTLVQSKLSNFGGATLLASESNAELAISATKIISIMLAPIPVIHTTHWYVNFLCPFFSFAQWTLWRTVMIHRLFFHSFYWLKTGRRQQGIYLCTIFFAYR